MKKQLLILLSIFFIFVSFGGNSFANWGRDSFPQLFDSLQQVDDLVPKDDIIYFNYFIINAEKTDVQGSMECAIGGYSTAYASCDPRSKEERYLVITGIEKEEDEVTAEIEFQYVSKIGEKFFHRKLHSFEMDIPQRLDINDHLYLIVTLCQKSSTLLATEDTTAMKAPGDKVLVDRMTAEAFGNPIYTKVNTHIEASSKHRFKLSTKEAGSHLCKLYGKVYFSEKPTTVNQEIEKDVYVTKKAPTIEPLDTIPFLFTHDKVGTYYLKAYSKVSGAANVESNTAQQTVGFTN